MKVKDSIFLFIGGREKHETMFTCCTSNKNAPNTPTLHLLHSSIWPARLQGEISAQHSMFAVQTLSLILSSAVFQMSHKIQPITAMDTKADCGNCFVCKYFRVLSEK